MAVGAFMMWCLTFRDIQMHFLQQHALCMDGRTRDETFQDAKFSVDAVQRDPLTGSYYDLTKMFCKIPVAVYPCTRSDPLCVASTPVWCNRVEDTGTECNFVATNMFTGGTNSFVGVCDEFKWDCANTKCTAYEKAKEQCAPKLANGLYKCYYVPTQIHTGYEISVRRGYTSWPVGLLIVSIAATAMACVCCFFACSRFYIPMYWARSRGHSRQAICIDVVVIAALLMMLGLFIWWTSASSMSKTAGDMHAHELHGQVAMDQARIDKTARMVTKSVEKPLLFGVLMFFMLLFACGVVHLSIWCHTPHGPPCYGICGSEESTERPQRVAQQTWPEEPPFGTQQEHWRGGQAAPIAANLPPV